MAWDSHGNVMPSMPRKHERHGSVFAHDGGDRKTKAVKTPRTQTSMISSAHRCLPPLRVEEQGSRSSAYAAKRHSVRESHSVRENHPESGEVWWIDDVQTGMKTMRRMMLTWALLAAHAPTAPISYKPLRTLFSPQTAQSGRRSTRSGPLERDREPCTPACPLTSHQL